jgi:phage FluMu protein Com
MIRMAFPPKGIPCKNCGNVLVRTIFDTLPKVCPHCGYKYKA